MRLEVQIAGDGDDPDDPSDEWPETRERITVGTLEVTGVDGGADDSIIFDPMRVADGIEPSADPVLRYRPPVYDLSYRARSARLGLERRLGAQRGQRELREQLDKPRVELGAGAAAQLGERLRRVERLAVGALARSSRRRRRRRRRSARRAGSRSPARPSG